MTPARAAAYLGSLVRTPSSMSGSGLASSAAGTSADGSTDAKEPISGTPVAISAVELDYMRALARFVGESPRRVKRLVNAYRLLKARMSDAQLSTFVADRKTEDGSAKGGAYQLAIAVLAIGTGAPAASQILHELAVANPQDKVEDIVKRWKERNQPDWTMAAQVIETLMQTQKSENVSELRGWARKVGRYLLSGPGEGLQMEESMPAATTQVAAGLPDNPVNGAMNNSANGNVTPGAPAAAERRP